MIESSKLSKRDQKNSKILQKELNDLHRDVEAVNRRGAINNKEEDSDNQLVDKKGKKWWNRFDQRHFSQVYQQEYLQIRDMTTSNRILQLSPKQSLSLSTYPQERITSDYDLFTEPQLIHVLYKSPTSPFYALTSYQLQQAIPSYADQRKEIEAQCRFKIIPNNPHVEIDPLQLKEIKLSLIGINDDIDFCRLVEQYKKTIEMFPNKNQIERELFLWNQDLHTINQQNNLGWDKLIKAIKRQIKQVPPQQEEISKIKEYLMWVTVLKYFEHGHSDKTMEMLSILIQNQKLLRPAKSNDANSKKQFETDCKICFCSFNNESNQVLYCDSCNTSFHLACYGLQEIPKEEIYYCDCCRFQKKYDYKKVNCQLCCKSSFPIKQMGTHFYHVTCLLLLNLAQIRDGTLALKDDLSHSKIMQMVVQNEVNQRECEFCARLWGYRLKCSYPGCTSCAHPICAYINGCKYKIKRDQNNKNLDVSYRCNAHDRERDWIQQTYIRRYMCNLRGVSSKSLAQFRLDYNEQIQKKHEGSGTIKRWQFSKIMAKTIFLKRRQIFKKEKKNSQNNQKIQTQTCKMLEKFKKNK